MVGSIELPEDVRWIPGYENHYAVSKDGVVWSYKGKKPRRLKLADNGNGYLRFQASMPGRRLSQTTMVHRVVLEAFVGPCPEGLEACHYDGDRYNNRLENLRWASRTANVADSLRLGTHVSQNPPRGEDAGRCVLSDKDVVAVVAMLDTGRWTQTQVAEMFGVTPSRVSQLWRARGR